MELFGPKPGAAAAAGDEPRRTGRNVGGAGTLPPFEWHHTFGAHGQAYLQLHYYPYKGGEETAPMEADGVMAAAKGFDTFHQGRYLPDEKERLFAFMDLEKMNPNKRALRPDPRATLTVAFGSRARVCSSGEGGRRRSSSSSRAS